MEKIKDLKFSITEEQERALWAEVLGIRYKLLINSDWTVLPDVRIHNKSEWRHWRDSVRKVSKKNHTLESAKAILAELTDQMPVVKYKNASDLSIADLKDGYINEIRSFFKNRFEDYLPYPINYEILCEKYEEAVDWTDEEDQGSLENYPLIKIEVEVRQKPVQTVVEEFLDLKRTWLSAVVRAEREMHEAIRMVEESKSVVELERIIARFI